MIFGTPSNFSITYEICELSNDKSWQFGLFNFVIDDVVVPAVGSNYTIHMAINHLKSSLDEISSCKKIDISDFQNEIDVIKSIAHSHAILLETDEDDLKLDTKKKKGVDLTPIEFTDIGFYIFYYLTTDSDDEFIIYTCDAGRSAIIKKFKRKTIFNTISDLRLVC